MRTDEPVDRPSTRPSLRKIASEAGVSKSTVSRVLREADPAGFSQSTQEKVRATARRLGWTPPSRIIDRPHLAMLALERLDFSTLPLHAEIAASAANEAAHQGADLSLVPITDLGSWAATRQGQIDGVILPHDLMAGLEAARSLRMPAVLINRISDLPVDQVQSDDAGGIQQAMDHLLGLGHRRFCWIGGGATVGQHPSLAIRRNALREHCRHAGATLVECDWVDCVPALLDRSDRPTAVICHGEYIAPPLLALLAERRMRVSHDLTVVVVGVVDFLAWTCPAVAVIELPIRAMTKAAVKLLVERIRSPGAIPPVTLHLAQRFLHRGCCLPPPR